MKFVISFPIFFQKLYILLSVCSKTRSSLPTGVARYGQLSLPASAVGKDFYNTTGTHDHKRWSRKTPTATNNNPYFLISLSNSTVSPSTQLLEIVGRTMHAKCTSAVPTD